MKSVFFEQCEGLGLTSNSAIAGSFMVSSQTIKIGVNLMRFLVGLFALHAVREGSTSTNFDFSDFKKWQRDNGVNYEQTGIYSALSDRQFISGLTG